LTISKVSLNMAQIKITQKCEKGMLKDICAFYYTRNTAFPCNQVHTT
jgi:hypothetical protein